MQETPLPAPIRKRSVCIAGGRYLLRHFGYKGNLLPEIEENEPINLTKVLTDIEVMGKLNKAARELFEMAVHNLDWR